MQLTWAYKSFNELTPHELYAILQLRIEVFSIDKNCIYQDADGKDQESFHLCGWDAERLAAYCRILPAGVSYDHPSIGRVVTSIYYRRSGFGKQLMERAIVETMTQMRDPVIIISAQLYLKKFYESLGFKQTSETYLEDDIPHIKMQRIG